MQRKCKGQSLQGCSEQIFRGAPTHAPSCFPGETDNVDVGAEITPFEFDPVSTGVKKKNYHMKHSHSWTVAMSLMATVPCLASSASTASEAGNAAENRSDSTVVELRGVEVTANRAGKKTPVAFTNISQKEISAVNDGRDVPSILEMTPSIVANSDAGAGVGYSGIRVRGSDASRINITANGVPINDSESHNVYWVNMPDLASSVRDIQIQRGVGTSTNGAGAFGASINMLTDAPSTERSALV